jgi:ribosomal protein L37AE/L43A
MSKHAGRECPSCGKLMPRPFVTEFRRNAPPLRYWVCDSCGAEWTSKAPQVQAGGDGNFDYSQG